MQVETNEIPEFIAFLAEQGIAEVLLEKKHELQLLDLMVNYSREFGKR